MKKIMYPGRVAPGKHRRRLGSVLVLVMILASLVTMLAASSLRLTMFNTRMTQRSHLYRQALDLAEAGAERGIYDLRQGNVTGAFFTRTETVTSHSGDTIGQFVLTIRDANTATPVIESTGYVPSTNDPEFTRTVRVGAQADLAPPYFDWAVFSYDFFHFGSSYFFDSYDPTVAPHPSEISPPTHGNSGPGHGDAHNTPVNTFANLGAMGDADFGHAIDIHGSMQVGGDPPGHPPNIFGDDVDGNPNRLIDHSSPTPPPPFPDKAHEFAKNNHQNHLITINDEPFEGGLEMEADANTTIVFPPGIYFFTDIDLASNTELLVEPPGKVELYLESPNPQDEVIRLHSHTEVNANTALSENFTIFVKQGRVKLHSNAVMYTGIFAPNSEVVLQSNFDYFGAVVGNPVIMHSSINFHYDRSLGSTIGSEGSFLVTSWNEVAPPEE